MESYHASALGKNIMSIPPHTASRVEGDDESKSIELTDQQNYSIC